MPKPHVLHIYKDYYPPVLGGIEATINLMARGSLRDYEVSVLVCSGSPRGRIEMIDGARVVRVAEWKRVASAPISPSFVPALHQLAREADLLHFHHPNPTGDFAQFLVRSPKPAVMTYHSDVVRQRKAMWLYAPLQHFMMRRCRAIMPTSPNYLESSPWLQQYRDKCTVVPLGIDLTRFEKTPSVQAAAEELRALYPGPITVFVGRLRYYKGLRFLIDAMPQVPGTLLIGGTGPEEANLRRQIAELRLGDRVHLLEDLSEEQLVALLHAGDAFCMPSHLRSEAFGLSQVEAMACGLPVVSTRIGTGVPFVNQDGTSGITVPPEDPASIAAALNRLYADEDLRRRLGNGARTRAQQEFSAERMCQKVHAVYQGVLPAEAE